MSPFENISVDFLVTLGWQIEEDGGERRSGDRLASSTAFLQKMPLALLEVSPARESPSCRDWMRGIQDSQSRAPVTGLRKRVLWRESSLMRHAIRVTRKAVFLFAVLTTAAVWSRLA